LHLWLAPPILDDMPSLQTLPITIRPAYPEDEPAIRRLAALDSAPVPRGPLALAEVEGEVRVAVSTDGRKAIADPFHRTLELVALVRGYAVDAAAVASS
jgi:hypothetical protein